MYELVLIYFKRKEAEKARLNIADPSEKKEQINCLAEIIVNNLIKDDHDKNTDQSVTS